MSKLGSISRVDGFSTKRDTILVVDDDPDNVAILIECLKDLYRVQVATSGDEALRIIASESPPDLVTLDVLMPGLDGFSTCRRIRQDSRGKGIPVFFLTSLTTFHDEAEGFACGAVDYIQKPLSPPLVRARIAAHLELKRARTELEDRNRLLLEKARLQAEVDMVMHHDLKNGLSVVLAIPDKLLFDENLTAVQTKALELVRKAGMKMLQIMERADNRLRLEAGEFVPGSRAVALGPLVDEVIEGQRWASEAKALVWDISREAPAQDIAGDDLLLYSLLANLAKNAVEAAPRESTLHLSMGYTDQSATVILRNLGAIPQPIRGRFFEKYATYGKEGGTGLGDYTAALITKAHGGSLEAWVIDETETEIRLSLPLFHQPD